MPSPAISAAVASAPPNPAGSALAASGTGSNASATAPASGDAATLVNGGFASLLLSQMTPMTEQLPTAASDTAKKDDSKDDSGTGNSDFSALFAALGMAQMPSQTPVTAVKTTADTGADSEKKPLEALSLQSTASKEILQTKEDAPSAGTGGDSQDPDGKAANLASFDKTLAKAEATLDTSQSTAPDAPQGAHAIHAMTHTNTTPATIKTEARLETPVRDPNWGKDLGQKIVWMANQDKQSAQLTLNPPQLGPLEVSLKINGDQATAVFVSAHAEVREAIEAALPRLREMMGAAGLELGQANVSSQSFQQQNEQARQQASSSASSRGGSEGGILRGSSESVSGVREISRRGNGMVDTFA